MLLLDTALQKKLADFSLVVKVSWNKLIHLPLLLWFNIETSFSSGCLTES